MSGAGAFASSRVWIASVSSFAVMDWLNSATIMAIWVSLAFLNVPLMVFLGS